MKFRGKQRYRWAGALIVALLASAFIAGCGPENQSSILQPSGPIAESEAGLFWFIFWVSTIIFVIVTGVLVYSIFRFRSRPGAAEPRQIHGSTPIEIAWTIVPSVVLFAVLIATISTMFGLTQPSQEAFTIKVTGHQWWWEVQYPDQQFVTANEIHIPVGKVVKVQLESDNVIHSFWVPELAGKMDVIPGHHNVMWLKADNAGTYRGECTEFCGEQHAHMNFLVVADEQSAFDAWVSVQQTPPSAASQAMAGQKLFALRCATCHHIDGQPANKNQIGPNITHISSRLQIGAGILDYSTENLAAWIHDTQQFKPGNDMPNFTTSISQSDLDSIVAYLESIK